MNYDKDYDDLDNYLEEDDYNYDEERYNQYDNEYKNYYYDNEEEDPSYQTHTKKSINDIFNDDEEDELNESDNKLINAMDNDLAGYFSDARLFAPKKKMVDTMKKKPKRIFHKAEAKVIVSINRQTLNAKVLFGPYESNKKQVYQLELDTGELAEIDEKKIKPVA